MEFSEIILKTEAFVQNTLRDAESGHDWHHIYRVRNMALYLQEKEGGTAFTLEMAALLHDISDAKFNGGQEDLGALKAATFLKQFKLEKELLDEIIYLVEHCSYKGGHGKKADNLNLKILQDADRLDAIGAIGIARTFNYGGYKNAPLHLPQAQAREEFSLQEYRKDTGSTIHHFYEKLLKLKDEMNTASARQIAEERHQFMLTFLDQFYREWDWSKRED